MLLRGSASEGAAAEDGAAEAEGSADDGSLSSAKLDAMVAELQERQDEHPKSVVFTQFGASTPAPKPSNLRALSSACCVPRECSVGQACALAAPVCGQ